MFGIFCYLHASNTGRNEDVNVTWAVNTKPMFLCVLLKAVKREGAIEEKLRCLFVPSMTCKRLGAYYWNSMMIFFSIDLGGCLSTIFVGISLFNKKAPSVFSNQWLTIRQPNSWLQWKLVKYLIRTQHWLRFVHKAKSKSGWFAFTLRTYN